VGRIFRIEMAGAAASHLQHGGNRKMERHTSDWGAKTMIEPAPRHYHLDSWDDIRFVLAVARAGSFYNAGQSLATSQSTVSRRVQFLEKRLGTKIFDRHSHGMRLTSAGSELVARARAMEDAAHGIERHLSGTDMRMTGVVRLSAPDGLLTHWLVPALAEFRAAFPGIRVDLMSSSKVPSLGTGETDVAICMNYPVGHRIVAMRAADIRFTLFAAPIYIGAFGVPTKRDDLADHWIVEHTGQLALHQLDQWRQFIDSHPRVACHADTSSSFMAALLSGFGIGLCPDFYRIVQPELVPIAVDTGCSASVWLISHQETNRSARIRALLNFLKRRFKEHRGIWFSR
jgi:DNA-binding transcriptional LysR family regulator